MGFEERDGVLSRGLSGYDSKKRLQSLSAFAVRFSTNVTGSRDVDRLMFLFLHVGHFASSRLDYRRPKAGPRVRKRSD